MYRRKSIRMTRGAARDGVAATELAVCMPVIVLIVLATIEACAMIFLQQSLSVAAYEGARVSLAPSAQTGNVTAQCQLILDDRDVRGAKINVSPGNISGLAPGTWINVETSAPFAPNSLVGGWLFSNRTLTASVQMVKER